MQAVPIPDPQILAKIHQTYRIGYMKVCQNPTEIIFQADDATKNVEHCCSHTHAKYNAIILTIMVFINFCAGCDFA